MTPDPHKYWEVVDRTTGEVVDPSGWTLDPGEDTVHVTAAVPMHEYTVSFLAYIIWDPVEMYNHLTNHWDKEHLMPIDPRRPEARAFLTDWLRNWCENPPPHDGGPVHEPVLQLCLDLGLRRAQPQPLTDWGSYDFTVSEQALADFAAEYGYELTAEDFINKGNFQVTHQPPTAHKRDYMAFTQRFVASYGRTLVDLVHQYGKKAYVFYDDSWIGVEPYGPYFPSIGFDGIIKCVFSGYEVRMCSGVPPRSMNCACTPTSSRWGWAVRRPSPRAAIPPAMPARTGTMSAAPCCGPRSTASAWAATCTF